MWFDGVPPHIIPLELTFTAAGPVINAGPGAVIKEIMHL